LASQCPYCGSERLKIDDLGDPTAKRCRIEVTCGGCGFLHYINYTATSITLVTTDDPPRLIDFFLPVAELEDQGVNDPENAETVPVGICTGQDGLIVVAYGYGDFGSSRGYGSAVVIENYQGSLRLLIWGDINREDAVQIIDLAPAKESTREDDGVFPYRTRRFDRQGMLIEEHVFGTAEEAQNFASPSLANIPGHRAVVCHNAASDNVLWDSTDAGQPGAVDRVNNRVSANSAPANAEGEEGAEDFESLCDCERPGYFFSGLPGILARVENGYLVSGAKVERCDLCQRYPSDAAAYKKLAELGIV
jgi:hypothetical protein